MMHIIIKYLIFGKSSVSNIYMKWGETTRCETTWSEYASRRAYSAIQRRFLT